MTSLAQLREKQKAVSAALASGEVNKTEYQKDERSWYPQLAEDGSSTSTIRFLPMSKEMLEAGMKLNWVTEYTHNFKGSKGWLNEKCRTMLGSKEEKCPICEENKYGGGGVPAWDDNDESVKAAIRKSGKLRKVNNYCNILVVDDKANPENNGKVMYFKFKAELMKLILAAAKADPDDPDSQPKKPFDLEEGHDFVLKTIRNNYKQIEYGQSKFKEKSRPIATSEKAIEEIWAKCIDLREFVNPDHIKSYDDLKKKLDQVNGSSSSNTPSQPVQAPATRFSSPVTDDEQEVSEDFLRSLAEAD